MLAAGSAASPRVGYEALGRRADCRSGEGIVPIFEARVVSLKQCRGSAEGRDSGSFAPSQSATPPCMYFILCITLSTYDPTQKSEQILKVVDAYAAEFHIDPEVLKEVINAEYLSDEVSGPEDESVETKEAWKVRMAAISGMSLEPNGLENLYFLEILKPGWRSDSVRFSFPFTHSLNSDAPA